MPKISLLDGLALVWFLLCWAGYAYYTDIKKPVMRGILGATFAYRRRWMQELLKRENRVVDTTLVGNLMTSVSFFASTTIFIIAGIIAVLGSSERAIEIVSDLPFYRETSRTLWELKLLLLLAIFIYAFFEFTWSLREHNFLSILIGSAPSENESASHADFVERATQLSFLAGENFNRGLRAYYFGLAALTWFVQPVLFMFVSALIVGVLYRRDFASGTLRALEDKKEEVGR